MAILCSLRLMLTTLAPISVWKRSSADKMVPTQEPEAGGLFDLGSWKPVWARQLDSVSNQTKGRRVAWSDYHLAL